MEYLGYGNDPSCSVMIDRKVDEAHGKGWKIERKELGGCVTEYSCPEGGWMYRLDASD